MVDGNFQNGITMNITKPNCLVVKGLTPMEGGSYFEKFGEFYWNDTENIVCIPLDEMNEHQISKLEMFFATVLGDVQYLIIHL